MTIPDEAPAFSEAARERETFKYDSLEISTAALHDADARPIPSAVLSSTPDPGLTAFAQLGLYRLNGSRALVSLFDRKSQHIVAEAVRTTPLSVKDEHKEQLWLCGTAVPRATSICEHVLAGPASSLTIPGNATGNAPGDLPVSIVLNIDEDSRFCDVQDAAKKFYTGVPIRSPAGINIGVYCVFDDKPRSHVSAEEIQFIRDMSRTIMDYLEAKRSHECYRREERMVRGLGSFVEGKATLSNWSQSSNVSSFQDIPGVQEGSLNKKLGGLERRAGRSDHVAFAAETPPQTPRDGSVASAGREASRTPKPKRHRQPRASSADVLREDMERVFSKASNIIRESIEVEGVLYLDASVRSFGGLIGKELSSPRVFGKPSSDESSSDEVPSPPADDNKYDDEVDTRCRVLGFSTSGSSSVNNDAAVSPLTELPEKHLHWLLQRYPQGKIYNLDADASLESPVSSSGPSSSEQESEFEPDGSKVGYINSKSGSWEKSKGRKNVAYFLAKMFPGARSVAFVPLWDAQRNRWFAGNFVWTRTPTRIFTPENELSYLRVYGLTLMAEVTRLHIKAADKTKMDVLSSISHELRSPLHGVVGAVELLRQTPLDSSQEKTLRTIQISSRTLLDTIDHLLDYGKMNGLIQSASRLGRNNSSSRLSSRGDSASRIHGSLGMPVQLDRLTEEVVESVLAGYGYMHMSETNQAVLSSVPARKTLSVWQQLRDTGLSRDPSPSGTPPSSEAVRIYLDVEPSDSWAFRCHGGAFRRIVMNLFGNSLKFTQAGFISVHLRQDTSTELSDGHGNRVNKVLLTVSDSGKGISEDYLRNHLYTPFAQEDHFAPGTGLGLSLVRQVVISMGGGIHVASEVGHGTVVTVSLPLPSEPEAESDEEQAEFRAATQELAGLRVLVRGHKQEAEDGDATTLHANAGIHRRASKSQLLLAESICQEWFHMESISEEESRIAAPDFVISTDDYFANLEMDGNPDPAGCPHLFVCPTAAAAQSLARKHAIPTFFDLLSPPLGPRKLAKSLVDSRRLWKEAQPLLRQSATAALLCPQQPSSPKPLLLSTPSQSSEIASVLKSAGIIAEASPPLPPAPVNFDHAVIMPEPQPQPSQANGVTCEQADPSLPNRPQDLPLRPNNPRPSILIVDDNPINRKILSAYMKKLGLPYATSNDGLETYEKYKDTPSEYNCILTDISMPIMDGLESARRIREFEFSQQLKPCKIIALTGLSGADVQQDAFASGVDMFLTRPVTLKDIGQVMEALGVT